MWNYFASGVRMSPVESAGIDPLSRRLYSSCPLTFCPWLSLRWASCRCPSVLCSCRLCEWTDHWIRYRLLWPHRSIRCLLRNGHSDPRRHLRCHRPRRFRLHLMPAPRRSDASHTGKKEAIQMFFARLCFARLREWTTPLSRQLRPTLHHVMQDPSLAPPH